MKNQKRYPKVTLNRRQWLLSSLASLMAARISPAQAEIKPLLVGITPVFLSGLQAINTAWEAWLKQQLHQPTQFIQRRSYEEIVQLLRVDKIHAAWLCGYPYVVNRNFLDLAAVPVYKGSTQYHSYIIVAESSPIQSWQALKNRPFAYSDPLSNSGWLYPNYFLLKQNIRPQNFFGKTFFTWGHPNTVQAVAAGLAHGGAVDSYVWEGMRMRKMPAALKTRIIHRSQAFPQPAFVTTQSLAKDKKLQFSQALLSMGGDTISQKILKANELDGFAKANPQDYEVIQEMAEFVSTHG